MSPFPISSTRLEEHGAIDHFRSTDAPRRGWWFADSDVHKWLEGAILAGRSDLAEPVAEVIARGPGARRLPAHVLR